MVKRFIPTTERVESWQHALVASTYEAEARFAASPTTITGGTQRAGAVCDGVG
jgi:hypothetical protein